STTAEMRSNVVVDGVSIGRDRSWRYVIAPIEPAVAAFENGYPTQRRVRIRTRHERVRDLCQVLARLGLRRARMRAFVALWIAPPRVVDLRAVLAPTLLDVSVSHTYSIRISRSLLF